MKKCLIKASHWYPNCSNKIDKLRSHNGMLSVALGKGMNVDRDERGWKNMRLKIHARKTKENTILEKWPVGGSSWILAPTCLFCIPEDQKELGVLAAQSSTELSPCVLNHKSPKLCMRPLLLCPPLCQSLDAAYYFSHVGKSVVWFLLMQKGNERGNLEALEMWNSIGWP